jgi:hypothetical protein
MEPAKPEDLLEVRLRGWRVWSQQLIQSPEELGWIQSANGLARPVHCSNAMLLMRQGLEDGGLVLASSWSSWSAVTINVLALVQVHLEALVAAFFIHC